LNNTQFPFHHGGFLTLPWRSNGRFEPPRCRKCPIDWSSLRSMAYIGATATTFSVSRSTINERWSLTMKYIWLRPAGAISTGAARGRNRR
jgi:hypothetical protein